MLTQSIPLIEALEAESGKILVASHENPDADTLGSALALYRFLKLKGKDVIVGCKDSVPYFLDFLPDVENLKRLPIEEEFDIAIVVDASGFYRLGANVNCKRRARIDHHIGGEFYGELDYIDPNAPSTTSLIHRLLKHWDESKIDEKIAQNLYVGLATDTGFFRYSNTTAEVFSLAAELTQKGADPHLTHKMFSEREPLRRIELLKKVLETLEVYENGLVAGILVYSKFLSETGCFYSDTEGFVSFPRSLEGVEVAFALIERPEEGLWKVSLRSKGKVDVAKIAQKLGGGGHIYASGCKIRAVDAKEAVDRLLEAIREEFVSK
ncbi:MAG: bifunctional oligoribonuclease/PAP phosphatase NrnA [Aquificaceae bacterium]|nr:bifunctional oligoribonuclease/PAP phosphatase NrnA [Aquificaceae bacterium]MDW8237647.1 bifunctional oligoribonuclease/PAP phosphatase NrnA [Aquificaceae bacterium]